jgi:hypothetical protein
MCVQNYGSKMLPYLAKSPVSKSSVNNFHLGSTVLMFEYKGQTY